MTPSQSHARWTSGSALVLYIAAAKFLVQLLTAGRYGIFRDELYYLACSEHLAWGYVDQPPLIALIVWFVRRLFGESLIGLRLLPAIAGAALVWMSGQVTREMGGRRFAQALAALATFAVPIFLLVHHWLTMNAFEPLIWLGAAWCVIRAINRRDAKYWLWFGVLIGLGMETKYSVVFFAFGVVLGLLLTSQRRFLKSKWIWLGALAAFLIFLPNLLWLIKHNFPFLELMHTIRQSGRDVARGPLAFVLDQAMIVNPILAPLWIGGLVWLFVGKTCLAGKGEVGNQTEERGRFRILGWAYLFMLIAFIVLKAKNYYLAPAYPILFAAGAIAFERLTRTVQSPMSKSQSQLNTGTAGVSPTGTAGVSPAMSAQREQFHGSSLTVSEGVRFAWSKWVYVALIIVTSAALAPLSLPILSPENYIRYQRVLGFEPPKAENQNTGPMPQHFADEFGWEDMTREVAKVYHALPPDERARTAIFANSYGQAGAIDFFGPKYGLPKAISNHQNYWYWGPRDYDGSTVIVLGSDGDGDREHFKTVDAVGRTFHPYSRRDEHFEIFLCRGLNQHLHTLWPGIKKWN